MAEPEYLEKNPLAELAEEAEELKRVLEDLKFDRRVAVCDKLQRIVAELAKVKDVKVVRRDKVHKRPYSWQAVEAIVNCRAVAEEGANNG